MVRILTLLAVLAAIAAESSHSARVSYSQEATIDVTTTDDSVAADGECSLREALANAAAQAATHADCTTGSVFNEVVLPGGTIVLNGTELTVEGAVRIRGAGSDSSIISGNDASGVFSVESGGSVAFEDLAIIDGLAVDGGAIYHALGELTVTRVRFEGNHATNAGGAIFSSDTASLLAIIESDFVSNVADSFGGAVSSDSESEPRTVSIVTSTFTGNTTPGGGGAVQARAGEMSIEGSSFTENEAGAGGALALSSVEVTMTDTFVGTNSATNAGGGLSLVGGTATLTRVTVRENLAADGGGIAVHSATPPASLHLLDTSIFNNDIAGNGGGIFFEEGELTLERATVSLNRGDAGGGGIWVWLPDGGSATLDITDSWFNYNSSAGSAGGIGFHGTAGTGTISIDSSTFLGNSAPGYSALGVHGVTGTIVNSTFTSSPGTAVRVSDPSSAITITNSTFAGDTEGNIAAPTLLHAIHDAAVTVNNSVFVLARETSCVEENNGTIDGAGNADDDGTCPGAIDVPGDTLRPIALVGGGFTLVHMPVAGSPVINAGNPAFCPEVDQRGRPRNAASCDIGSVEFYYTAFAPQAAKQ